MKRDQIERRYRGAVPERWRCALTHHIWKVIDSLSYAGPFAVYCERCKEHRLADPTATQTDAARSRGDRTARATNTTRQDRTNE